MKTLEEIKNAIIASNPSTIYTFNGEEFQMSKEEIDKAIQDRAQMEYNQQIHLEELKQAQLSKVAAYNKLGLDNAEIVSIMGLSEDGAKALGL